MPRGSSGYPKKAEGEPIRRSQSSARANPPASAGPLTAATIGRRQLPTASKATVLVSTSRLRCSRSPPNCDVSMPEQKAVPAPVSTTQPTPSSRERCPKAFASSCRSSIESAFRFSGRRRVTTATSSWRSSESTPDTERTLPRTCACVQRRRSGGVSKVLARRTDEVPVRLVGYGRPGGRRARTEAPDLGLDALHTGALRDRQTRVGANGHRRPAYRHGQGENRGAGGRKRAPTADLRLRPLDRLGA